MLDCVLVIQAIHLMVQCLRFTSLNKKRKDEGEKKIMKLLAVYVVYFPAGPGQ